MAEKSGFFNALMNNGAYDRTYNADDYCDNLAVVISNGVLRSTNDDLKVTAKGLVPTVGVGRAWINGHYYINETPIVLAPITPPTGGSRIDSIVLRFNNNLTERTISVQYIQGTASNEPTAPAITRTDLVYDLVLADILVAANAATLNITDTRDDADLCGWVYSTSGDNSFFTTLDNEFFAWFKDKKDTLSSVTLFKRYRRSVTLDTATNTVPINIPQYDQNTSQVTVYVNGFASDEYSIEYSGNGSYILFTSELIVGTEIIIEVWKSIDGTGIMSVADEITELQNQVAAMQGNSKFTYVCTGTDDNISLSQIAQALYTGGYIASAVKPNVKTFIENLGGVEYLESLPSNAQVEIEVVGALGVGAPVNGTGTSSSRYRYFELGMDTASDKKIVFNFAKCDKIPIKVTTASSNIIFFGVDCYVKNATVQAFTTEQGVDIQMVAAPANDGNIEFTDCRLSVSCSGNSRIATNGTFVNCYCRAFSSDAYAAAFYAYQATALIRVLGGTVYAYARTANQAACLSASGSSTILASGVNFPTKSYSNYSQMYYAYNSGANIYSTNSITTLSTSGTITELGKIAQNKPI